MAKSAKSTEELILEVLREVLARQTAVESQPIPPPAPAPTSTPAAAAPTLPPAPKEGAAAAGAARRHQALQQQQRYEQLAAAPRPADPTARRLLLRLTIGVFLAILLINIPLVRGLPLARALPDSRALIIRDGLVLKGSGERIYVLQGNEKRWISSLDAFAHYGFKWELVHQVDDAFLARFPDGPALHVLVKCSTSPHIYRLENNHKRWIKDIATFEAEGHVWGDVRFLSCEHLRSLPDGPTIPEDAGPPPQP